MTRRQRKACNPSFRKRWFADDTTNQCVNWYLRFKLRYKDLALMMGQLGVSMAPSSILRCLETPALAKRPNSSRLLQMSGLLISALL